VTERPVVPRTGDGIDPPQTRAVRVLHLGLAVLAGAVAALGQSPFSLVFLSLPGFGVAFWLISRAAAPRRAAVLGWAAGVGYFGLALNWIVEPFFVDAARDGWMAPFAIVFMAAGLALFWGAAAFVARWLVGRNGSVPALALAWTAALTFAEYARGHVLTGFPWALPGYIWIDTGMAQLAALIGPYGLTFLTVGISAALSGAAFPARAARLAAATGAVAPVLISLGLAHAIPPAPEDAEGPVIRLVQPNAPQALKWRADMVETFFLRGLELTAAPADPPPDLVVWSETALPQFLNNAGPLLREISEAAGGVPVVAGAMRRSAEGLMNSLVVIRPDGTPGAVYDKAHLVPFGEYTPLLASISAFGLDEWGPAGFRPGPGPAVIDAGVGGPFQPLICYEVIFPDELRAAPVRPRWLLQITNDAWFGDVSGPYQHLDQARMRAIEMGLPLMRAANTGVSAVIDARGRVLASLPLGQAGYLDARLPPALPPTPYARFGDLPVLALLALCGLATLFQRRRNIH